MRSNQHCDLSQIHTHARTHAHTSPTHPDTAHVAMLHIKLMGMENRTPYKYILCPYTHPRPPGWGSKGQNKFTESSQVAYQINGNGT